MGSLSMMAALSKLPRAKSKLRQLYPQKEPSQPSVRRLLKRVMHSEHDPHWATVSDISHWVAVHDNSHTLRDACLRIDSATYSGNYTLYGKPGAFTFPQSSWGSQSVQPTQRARILPASSFAELPPWVAAVGSLKCIAGKDAPHFLDCTHCYRASVPIAKGKGAPPHLCEWQKKKCSKFVYTVVHRCLRRALSERQSLKNYQILKPHLHREDWDAAASEA